jgi:hypothetical protein
MWDWKVAELITKFSGVHHPIVILSGFMPEQEKTSLARSVLELKGQVIESEGIPFMYVSLNEIYVLRRYYGLHTLCYPLWEAF